MCNTKKSQQHRNIVVRPITTKDFNLRSQVHLIDFQSTSGGDYKWLMKYQNHATKFCLLRPLKTKRIAEVALEWLKVFLDFDAPYILQSYNCREFTSNIINELSAVWPDCKIVHGRPRHPQSQGSMESCNQGIENKLRAWMDDNGSTDCEVAVLFSGKKKLTKTQSYRTKSVHRTFWSRTKNKIKLNECSAHNIRKY
ncbi:KRAB-A domain-containing protein 2 [Araneus ventricosus]|uniref:KRAB-A domain-containing protein 2 n=1 Tax=Araneus ventricosus TaxID=182803 RepID=A0A4Y2CRU8_ARAVE|nr:KRAB-A domain-containing protein 2 [Araneus ventricosus]